MATSTYKQKSVNGVTTLATSRCEATCGRWIGPHGTGCSLFEKIVKTRLAALKYSYDGFVACFRDELAFRLECVFAIPHFIMIFVVQMDVWMRVLMGVLWFILIAVELLNSGLEAIVDLASPEYHALAKKAKDCGSAAVFCVLMLIVGCWIIAIGGF